MANTTKLERCEDSPRQIVLVTDYGCEKIIKKNTEEARLMSERLHSLLNLSR